MVRIYIFSTQAYKTFRDKQDGCIKVGLNAKIHNLMANLAPGMADRAVAKLADQQHYDEPPRNPEGTLDRSSELVGTAGQMHGSGGIEKQS